MGQSIPVGIGFSRPNSGLTIEAIKQAEQMGMSSVALFNGPIGPDPMGILTAAAVQTSKIKLGTAISVTYPRHPLALASQALTIEDLAPGRLRLGLGSSHPFVIEGMYGLQFGKPLTHLREYVAVLRSILWEGKVNFAGEYFRVNIELPPMLTPPRTPIFIATTRKKSFELAGEIADGALPSWIPKSYLQAIAYPALQAGARRANRPVPPLMVSAHIIMDTDFANVRRIALQALSVYTAVPAYQEIFAEAGFPLAADGTPSDELIHELFIYGDTNTIRQRLYELHAAGAAEINAGIHPVKDQISEEMAVMEILSNLVAV